MTSFPYTGVRHAASRNASSRFKLVGWVAAVASQRGRDIRLQDASKARKAEWSQEEADARRGKNLRPVGVRLTLILRADGRTG
jgi:hypothetical protein